jgi:DNA-binding response OmpR family regulator
VSVLVLCDDLLFTSKVTATARALGLSAAVARTPEAAVTKAVAAPPATVIVDLHLPGLDLPALLAGLRAAGRPPQVVGFGSHVDVETLKAARSAGCDAVMPRSQFAKELEARLPEWATSASPLPVPPAA